MKLGSPTRFLVGLSLFTTTAACSPTSTSDRVERGMWDSAGVVIAEHDSTIAASLPEWGVMGLPQLDLGGGPDPSQQFTSVPGAARLSDGRLVVAEGRENELRVFDSAGALLQTIGRRGQGPGEFNRLAGIQLLMDDTIIAFDASFQSTVISGDGTYLGHVRYPRPTNPGSYFTILAHLASGGLLGTVRTARAAPPSATTPLWREVYALVVADTAGAITDTLAILPGALLAPVEIEEGGSRSLRWRNVAFGGTSHVVSDGLRIFIGSNETTEIRQYEGTNLRRVIRNLTPGTPVTATDRAEWLTATLGRLNLDPGTEEVKAERRRNAESTLFAEAFPFYGGLLLGTDGSLWVQAPQRYPDEGRRYLIYEREGMPVARIGLPDGVWPLQVGPTELVGLWLDADDVQHVRVWRVGPVGK